MSAIAPLSLDARTGDGRSPDSSFSAGADPVRAFASRLAVVCGVLACAIGGMGLLPVLFDLLPRIDRLLVMHRMAAGAFVLGGSGLILLNLGRARLASVLLFATLTLASINFIALEASLHTWFSEVLGVPLSDDVQMAPMTSALFIASASTMLLCRFRGEAAAVPAAIIGTLCAGLVSALVIRFTVAGDYWPVLASVTPHSGTAHALLALGSLASVVARQPALIADRQRRLVIGMVVFLTALTLVIVGSVSWRDYMATVRDVDGETRNLARLLEEHAHRRLDPVLLLTRQVAAAIEAPQSVDVASVRLFIEGSASGLPQLEALAVVMVEGDSASLYGPDLAWSDAWRLPVEGLAGSEALLLPDPVTGSFVLAVPLGPADVYVIARLDASYFRGFYRSLQLGEAGGAGLLSTDGSVLVEHRPVGGDEDQWVLLPGGFDDSVMAASFIDRSRASAPERFVAYRRSAALSFVVSASVALTPAIRHFETRLRTVLLLMLGGLAALGVAAHLQMRAIRRQEAARDALEASRDFADAVLNSMASCIAIIDGQGRIVASNRAWRNLRRASGCPDDDRAGLAACEVCKRSLRDGSLAGVVAEGVADVRSGQRDAFLTTYPCTVWGEPRWFNLRVMPFAGREGYVVMSHEDVTELKQVEQALEVAKREAEAANEAKTRFLANTSHELRTPLTAVLGLSRLLSRSPLEPAQRQHVERIEMAGKALLAIINDILDLSKIEAGKLELESQPFSIASLMAEIEAIFVDAAVSKGLTLEIAVDERVPETLRGDGIRLQQVLMNLVGNALKFTEHGGVVLEVRVIDARPDGAHLRFSIRDTGIGLTEVQVSGLFEPFVQADSSMARRFGGTGLGLAICRRLVEAMGSTLSVESCPGGGSSFFFTLSLPVADDSIEEHRATVPTRLEGCRVLVVEDNTVNRELICEVLELAGAEVIPAENGALAIDRLADPSFKVDCILMDIQMPGIDGLEATARIRAMGHRQSLPIVAVTANAMLSEVQACRQAGMNDYVTKPIDIDALVEAVAAQIRSDVPA